MAVGLTAPKIFFNKTSTGKGWFFDGGLVAIVGLLLGWNLGWVIDHLL